MLFNSIEFLVFFPVVTALYFILPHCFRWMLLLGASCFFYTAFIPAYIAVLAILIVVDYFAGIFIERTQDKNKKRIFLIISISATCLVLFVFKYYNFFTSTFLGIAHFFGLEYPVKILNIILPLGLSFHTFQSLSYVIEVYRGKQKAEHNFGIYALYVMFYPQLVAGPIERPYNLIHQFYEKHEFDYFMVVAGLKLMLWGFFKKLVIADRLALYVNLVYQNYYAVDGMTLVMAACFFTFQVYCDFSGYSDIAIGAARVMGFRLMANFRRPFLARNMFELWQRWHISLMTWFRDYVYIPLGGAYGGAFKRYRNLMIVFLLCGFWHGANWTFVSFGMINGFYLIVSSRTNRHWKKFVQFSCLDRISWLENLLAMLFVFILFSFSGIFFRAASLADAFNIIHKIIIWKGSFFSPGLPHMIYSFFGIIFLMVSEVKWEFFPQSRLFLNSTHAVVRWISYVFLIFLIISIGVIDGGQFIYFTF